ncbi:MAG: hypothetical protein HY319_07715 [Armatimonadetes bacterium]|nr:hypothetical protein [Armatimonadota bacterium]
MWIEESSENSNSAWEVEARVRRLLVRYRNTGSLGSQRMSARDAECSRQMTETLEESHRILQAQSLGSWEYKDPSSGTLSVARWEGTVQQGNHVQIHFSGEHKMIEQVFFHSNAVASLHVVQTAEGYVATANHFDREEPERSWSQAVHWQPGAC